jgi:hypothetical protein
MPGLGAASFALVADLPVGCGLQEMGNILVAAFNDILFSWKKWGTAMEQQPSFQYAMLQGTGEAATCSCAILTLCVIWEYSCSSQVEHGPWLLSA